MQTRVAWNPKTSRVPEIGSVTRNLKSVRVPETRNQLINFNQPFFGFRVTDPISVTQSIFGYSTQFRFSGNRPDFGFRIPVQFSGFEYPFHSGKPGFGNPKIIKTPSFNPVYLRFFKYKKTTFWFKNNVFTFFCFFISKDNLEFKIVKNSL